MPIFMLKDLVNTRAPAEGTIMPTDEMGSPGYKRKTISRKWMLLIFLVGFLFLGETGLEFREYIRGYNSMMFGLRAEVREDAIPAESTRGGEINLEWGSTKDTQFPFRSRRVPRKKRAGVVRVWVLSSSMAEDIYLPEYEIWPNLLDSALQELAPGRWVPIHTVSRMSS